MTKRTARSLKALPDCHRAFQHIARQCLADLNHHEAAARRGDAEAIHHIRIELTKLLSARKFFATMTRDASWQELKREIRWLNSELGAARDSDVAAGNAEAKSVRSVPGTLETIRRQVAKSHRRLTHALSSKRYQRLAATLSRWIEKGPWVTKQTAAARKRRMRSLADYATRRLAYWKKHLKWKGKGLWKEKKRHRLRLEAKRYRYMGEALKMIGLPESGEQARARKAAARVQGALGDLRDLRRFQRMYAKRHPVRLLDQPRKKKLIREAAKALRRLA
jgi:CHAD domain-containing protein